MQVVYATANVGMVFASAAATTMIGEFGAKAIVFTGVAGGLRAGQKIGDIVIGEVPLDPPSTTRLFLVDCPFGGSTKPPVAT